MTSDRPIVGPTHRTSGRLPAGPSYILLHEALWHHYVIITSLLLQLYFAVTSLLLRRYFAVASPLLRQYVTVSGTSCAIAPLILRFSRTCPPARCQVGVPSACYIMLHEAPVRNQVDGLPHGPK